MTLIDPLAMGPVMYSRKTLPTPQLSEPPCTVGATTGGTTGVVGGVTGGVTGGRTALVTVTVLAAELLAAKPASGTKRAVRDALPTVRNTVVAEATPSTSRTGAPICSPLTAKMTLP